MIINNDTVTEKNHSSSIKHCGLLRTREDLRVGAGTGIGLGKDTKSLGKSAAHWLSTIGEGSIAASRIHSGWMISEQEANDQWVHSGWMISEQEANDQCVHVAGGLHNQSHKLVHHIWL